MDSPSTCTASFVFRCSPLRKRRHLPSIRRIADSPGRRPRGGGRTGRGTQVRRMLAQCSPGCTRRRDGDQRGQDEAEMSSDDDSQTYGRPQMEDNWGDRGPQPSAASNPGMERTASEGLGRLWEGLKASLKPKERCKAGTEAKAGDRLGEAAAEECLGTAEGEKAVVPEGEEEREEEFVAFSVRVHLRQGHGLAVRDASGSSDPYVKCEYGAKAVYRSETVFRELNPNWDEDFAFLVDDPTEAITFKVFDYDRFMKDDFMGAATLELSSLTLFQKTDLKLNLADPRGECPELYLGYLLLSATLTPLTAPQREQFLGHSVRGIVAEQRPRRANKISTAILSRVNILLVEANLCGGKEARELAETHVKFKLGTEKFKSKRWYPLEEGAGSIHLLLTVTPTSECDGQEADSGAPTEQQMKEQRQHMARRYDRWQSLHSLKDVGHLSVTVYEAQGLASADLNGKSDPFCVLELVNLRAQTPTEYKTLNPKWGRTFTFFVKDVHEVLELTVFDEDPNKRAEFLGKLAIPLLKIKNGEKRWYALKDRKLAGPAKGHILVEATLHFNYLKAMLRTFKPRERKLVQPVVRFKRARFIANINRLKGFGDHLLAYAQFAESCLSWESYSKSVCALTAYVLLVLFVQLWHLPLLLLLFFLRSFMKKRLSDSFNAWARKTERRPLLRLANGSTSMDSSSSREEKEPCEEDEEEEVDEADEREGAKGEETSTSLRGRINAIQETLAMIQTKTDFLLGLVDRAKNTLNCTVPFLSVLAICVLCAATLLLCWVPPRWILLLWGINKFSKKLRDPNYVDNNELLDFLSRVPSNQELRNFRTSMSTQSPKCAAAEPATALADGSPAAPRKRTAGGHH